MRIRSLFAAAAASALVLAPAAAASADGHGAMVTVVHGVPDLTVDVWANGSPLLTDFEPGTVTDPVELPAGDYDLEIYAAGTDPEGNDPAIAGSASVTDGLNASVVAHLDAAGAPTLSVFVNDVSEIAAGEARLTVRHTAAAPAVDILAGGSPIFEGVENPAEGVVDVPAGDYAVTINAAGTDTVAFDAGDVTLAEGVNTIVYATGDLEGGSFGLAVQAISDLGGMPDGVPAGEAGLATDGTTAAMIAAGLMVVAGAAVVARRRVTA